MFGSLNLSVKAVRLEIGLSQSELAAPLSVGKRAVQSYEQEWRKPSDAVKRLLLVLVAHRNGAELPRLRC
ncbi:MAG: helix-turn-helix domain-containing protein [Armatimonadota bacterium]